MGFLAAAGAIAGIASSVMGIVSSAKSMHDANKSGSETLREQKELMKYQSDLQTDQWVKQYEQRHQLEVNDLKKAGLNPLLSAHSASGAPGVSASASPAETNAQRLQSRASLANSLANLQSALSNSALAKSQADTQETQQYVNKENVRTQRSQQLLNMNLANKATTESNVLAYDAVTRRLLAQSGIGLNMAQSLLTSARESNERDINLKVGNYSPIGQLLYYLKDAFGFHRSTNSAQSGYNNSVLFGNGD